MHLASKQKRPQTEARSRVTVPLLLLPLSQPPPTGKRAGGGVSPSAARRKKSHLNQKGLETSHVKLSRCGAEHFLLPRDSVPARATESPLPMRLHRFSDLLLAVNHVPSSNSTSPPPLPPSLPAQQHCRGGNSQGCPAHAGQTQDDSVQKRQTTRQLLKPDCCRAEGHKPAAASRAAINPIQPQCPPLFLNY